MNLYNPQFLGKKVHLFSQRSVRADKKYLAIFWKIRSILFKSLLAFSKNDKRTMRRRVVSATMLLNKLAALKPEIPKRSLWSYRKHLLTAVFEVSAMLGIPTEYVLEQQEAALMKFHPKPRSATLPPFQNHKHRKKSHWR